MTELGKTLWAMADKLRGSGIKAEVHPRLTRRG